MWVVIVVSAVVIAAAGLAVRRHRSDRSGEPGFAELSREEQIQVMRHAEGGAVRRGDREGAKHQGAGRFGETAGPSS